MVKYYGMISSFSTVYDSDVSEAPSLDPLTYQCREFLSHKSVKYFRQFCLQNTVLIELFKLLIELVFSSLYAENNKYLPIKWVECWQQCSFENLRNKAKFSFTGFKSPTLIEMKFWLRYCSDISEPSNTCDRASVPWFRHMRTRIRDIIFCVV